jgi:hypothetical protein
MVNKATCALRCERLINPTHRIPPATAFHGLAARRRTLPRMVPNHRRTVKIWRYDSALPRPARSATPPGGGATPQPDHSTQPVLHIVNYCTHSCSQAAAAKRMAASGPRW